MKLIFTLILLFVSALSLSSQSFLLRDYDHTIFQYQYNAMYLDQDGDDYIMLINENNAGESPYIPGNFKMKRYDKDFKLLQEKVLFQSVVGLTTQRIGDKYVMFREESFNDVGDAGTFMMCYIADKDFNLTDKVELKISDTRCNYYSERCGIDLGGRFYTNAEGITAYFTSIMMASGDCILLTILFDQQGHYIEHRTQTVFSDTHNLTVQNIFKKNNSDNIIVPTSLYFFEFDTSFSFIGKISSNSSLLPATELGTMQYAAIDQGYLEYGVHLTIDGLWQGKFFSAQIDNSFKLQKDKLKYFNFRPGKDDALYDFYSPPGCFNQEEDGNYTAITSYNFNLNDIGGYHDTVPGRLIITRFSPDQTTICHAVYQVPNSKLNLHACRYLGNGRYLVAGSIDSIEYHNLNKKKQYNPFVAIIEPGCDIPWAVKTEGTLSTSGSVMSDDEMILFPNPASDYITLPLNKELDSGGEMRIYDATGRKVVSGKIDAHNREVSVRELHTGVYLCVINTAAGKTLTGRFVKG